MVSYDAIVLLTDCCFIGGGSRIMWQQMDEDINCVSPSRGKATVDKYCSTLGDCLSRPRNSFNFVATT